MRAWPLLQLIVALGFLGAAIFALSSIVGSDDRVLDPEDATGEMVEASDSTDVRLFIRSTSKIVLKSVEFAGSGFSLPSPSGDSWSFDETVNADGPLRIEGAAEPDALPFALRVEVDVPGQPLIDQTRWIENSPFRVILYFNSRELDR